MTSGERSQIALLGGGAAVLLVWGWRTFWFLTDDAFIAFRYVSNRVLGHGYVWNPPPFRPVEGYTSFLWVVLLDGVWSVLGVEPPDAANVLSLLCAAGSLVLLGALVWRLDWSPALRPFRTPLLGLALLGTLANPTFLAWTSSGLETALFNFLLTLWVYGMLYWTPAGARGLCAVSSVAGLMALTRPDGLLFAVLTVAAAAMRSARRPRRLRLVLAAAAPLIIVLLHLLWRRATYGFWLPNTYHAKVGAPWPSAGWRYLLAFVLEYAWWAWLPPAALALAREGRRLGGRSAAWVLIGLTAHAGYYVLMVGGDHFEYRIFSHLVPLLFAAAVWMTLRAGLSGRRAVVVVAVLVGLTLPIPWAHRAAARKLDTRRETRRLAIPLAASFPAPASLYVHGLDGLQRWLADHYVGLRHQEHRINLAYLQRLLPSRETGSTIRGNYPVLVFPAVGYAAWVLPHANVLDTHGLNDAVVARSPPEPGVVRRMAHEHVAPREYLGCFRPDLSLRDGRLVRVPRAAPLTAEAIEACEALWYGRVGLEVNRRGASASTPGHP